MRLFNVEKVLPFLDKAPVISRGTQSVERVRIFTLPAWEVLNSNKPIPPFVTGVLVEPLGIVVLDESPDLVVRIKREVPGLITVRDLKVVDYRVVANILEIDNNTASYPGVSYGSYETQTIITESLINEAILGNKLQFPSEGNPEPVDSNEPKLEDVVPTSALASVSEELSLDSLKGSPVVIEGEESEVMIRLRSYFEGGYTTNRVPLLVGQSAVGKSAVIKALAAEYNMRIVDIRTAFTSRLDLEGLTQKVDMGDRFESFNCPMSDFVEVTDAYIDYCTRAVEILKEEIDNTQDDARREDLEYALAKFEEGAKTPVLLFDEVTRGEASVRQALTKILTDKEFMGYSMKKARVIAATNAVVDDSGLPSDIFQTKQIDDVAFFDRFESIPITVSNSYPGWKKWASAKSSKYSGTNIHESILPYVTASEDNAYNIRSLVQAYEKSMNSTGDMNEVTTTVYPNYRTWERVSDYLYSCEDSMKYSLDIISALVGPEAAANIQPYLKQYGFVLKNDESEDFLTKAVGNGLDSNTPTLLISPSSMGKTSRIKKAAEDRGYTFIQVNLGQMDRLDLSGPPVKVSIDRFILDKKVSVTPEVKEKLAKELKSSGIPMMVTMRAPKASLVKAFTDARNKGRKVCLFYDEMNRVQNPAIMSSVFEAISDHKAFGIDFDPDSVAIFAACNLGENVADAESLDPAIANRFAVYWKKDYDKDDVDSFIKYAESSGMSNYTLSWLKGMKPEEVLKVIKSIDSRTVEFSAASTRGIEDLDRFIKDTKNNQIIAGALVSVGDNRRIIDRFRVSGDLTSAVKVLEMFTEVSGNWAGLRSKQKVKVGNEIAVPADLMKLAVQIMEKQSDNVWLSSNRNVIINLVNLLISIDLEIRNKRNKCFEMFLGAEAPKFGNYYNEVSGRLFERVEVVDCIDLNVLPKYVDQEFRFAKNAAEYDKVGVRIYDAIFNEFGSMFPVANCRKLLELVAAKMISTDGLYNFLRLVSLDIGGKDELFRIAENGDASFAEKYLSKVGVKVVTGVGTGPVVLK